MSEPFDTGFMIETTNPHWPWQRLVQRRLMSDGSAGEALRSGNCETVTAVIAEVRRLRAENAELRAKVRRWMPRTCARCGYQNGGTICTHCGEPILAWGDTDE